MPSDGELPRVSDEQIAEMDYKYSPEFQEPDKCAFDKRKAHMLAMIRSASRMAETMGNNTDNLLQVQVALEGALDYAEEVEFGD